MLEISEREGWPYYTVKYWMQKHDIQRRSKTASSFLGYWNKRDDSRNFCKPPSTPLSIKEVKYTYYEQGLSVPEASRRLKRSETVLYKFMKRNGLARRTATETNALVFDRKELSYTLKQNLSEEEQQLKLAGIMLYWAEGTKARFSHGKKMAYTVDLANSDPNMIKLFMRFLREICGVDERRLRVYLYCFANQNVNFLKKYWNELTSIPLNQFIKPYIQEKYSLDKIDKMKYGLVHIRYSDKKLFSQIMKWIDEYLSKAIESPM